MVFSKTLKLLLLVVFLLAVPLIFLGTASYLKEENAAAFIPKKHRLNYAEIGVGPTKVLLLHGVAASHRYWEHGIKPLTAGRTFLIPDLLGFGESPKPRANYSLGDHKIALKQLLKEKFGSGRFFIVGHSFGALLGLTLALDMPEQVLGVVAISTPIFADREDVRKNAHHMSTFNKITFEKMWYWHALCYLRPLFQFLPLAGMMGVPREVYEDAMKHTWISLSGTIEHAYAPSNLAERLAKRKISVVFVHGDSDKVTPFKKIEETFFQKSPLITVKRLKGGHQLPLSNTEAIWKIIDTYTVTTK